MLRSKTPHHFQTSVKLPTEAAFLKRKLGFTRTALLGVSATEMTAEVVDWVADHSPSFITTPLPKPPSLWQTGWQAFWQFWQWSLIGLAMLVAAVWYGPQLLYQWQSLPNTTTWSWQSVVSSVTGVGQSLGLVSPTDSTTALAVTPVAGQSGQPDPQATTISQTDLLVELPPTTADRTVRYLPPINPDLPMGDWLVIPKIGVRSQLQATADYQDALDTGLWRVPDFGEPGSLEVPMIVAGHRYGWKWWWKDDYWRYNSFYLLPELQVGDRVEVISQQRKWTYEIYAAAEGTEITDYEGDMILYTCKYLESPLRYFRYARIVETET